MYCFSFSESEKHVEFCFQPELTVIASQRFLAFSMCRSVVWQFRRQLWTVSRHVMYCSLRGRQSMLICQCHHVTVSHVTPDQTDQQPYKCCINVKQILLIRSK